ncbi:hypothetical protein [Nocardioides sp. TF02-7]|nr:hypothetical protein [Nocardioides sp. TF02-7]UMG91682.1 hypothetical protein MF408_16570 [Nocardioides sp. TF02-7]
MLRRTRLAVDNVLFPERTDDPERDRPDHTEPTDPTGLIEPIEPIERRS